MSCDVGRSRFPEIRFRTSGFFVLEVVRRSGSGGYTLDTKARRQKRVEVVVALVHWDEDFEYERIGTEDRVRTLLGVEIQEITVPIFPGKNITVIAETIAFNYLLRIDGYHAANEFTKRQMRLMRPGR